MVIILQKNCYHWKTKIKNIHYQKDYNFHSNSEPICAFMLFGTQSTELVFKIQ